jgi:hypothetical protein
MVLLQTTGATLTREEPLDSLYGLLLHSFLTKRHAQAPVRCGSVAATGPWHHRRDNNRPGYRRFLREIVRKIMELLWVQGAGKRNKALQLRNEAGASQSGRCFIGMREIYA